MRAWLARRGQGDAEFLLQYRKSSLEGRSSHMIFAASFICLGFSFAG